MTVKQGHIRRLEDIQWRTTSQVDKYSPEQIEWFTERTGIINPTGDQLNELLSPNEVVFDEESNLLTTLGLNLITARIIGASAQALDSTHTLLGVGNGNTAAAVGNTALAASAGAANQYWQVADATFPQQANGVITVKATYAAGDGNFVWNEWSIQDTTSAAASSATQGAGVMLNRKVASLGTKVSPAVWAHTVTVSLS